MASRPSSSKTSAPGGGGTSSSATGAGHGTGSAVRDPVLRNALRYTISAREYALLHKYVISRSRLLKRRAPSVDAVQKMMDGDTGRSGKTRAATSQSSGDRGKGKGKAKEKESDRSSDSFPAKVVGADDYNARAVRHSLRVFVATGTLMKLWEIVSAKLMAKKQEYVHWYVWAWFSFGRSRDRTLINYVTYRATTAAAAAAGKKKAPIHQSQALRLSLSLSTILLLYRLLFRFFTRLRSHVLDPSALPFRKRNPRIADTLTSPYAPAVGASLAGLALGIYPAQQLRLSITIYTLFRALEFGWNCAEDNGMVWGWERIAGGKVVKKTRPWWWGSWMLQPLAFGQLLHAVVFDRDCFPMVSAYSCSRRTRNWNAHSSRNLQAVGDFIFNHSTSYLHPKPEGFPRALKWPKTYEIVDSLAQMAKLNWP
jgi:hypothetical protein